MRLLALTSLLRWKTGNTRGVHGNALCLAINVGMAIHHYWNLRLISAIGQRDFIVREQALSR